VTKVEGCSIYRIDDGESRQRGVAGLSAKHDVMYTRRVGALSGAMAASMAGLARAMQIFALKMDQR
jgi:hypothetical protein